MTARVITSSPNLAPARPLYAPQTALLSVHRARSRASAFRLAHRRASRSHAPARAHWMFRHASRARPLVRALGHSQESIARLKGKTLAEYLAQQQLRKRAFAVEEMYRQVERARFNGQENWSLSLALYQEEEGLKRFLSANAKAHAAIGPVAVLSGRSGPHKSGLSADGSPEEDHEISPLEKSNIHRMLPSLERAVEVLGFAVEHLQKKRDSISAWYAQEQIGAFALPHRRPPGAFRKKISQIDASIQGLYRAVQDSAAVLPTRFNMDLKALDTGVTNLLCQVRLVSSFDKTPINPIDAADMSVQLGQAKQKIQKLQDALQANYNWYQSFVPAGKAAPVPKRYSDEVLTGFGAIAWSIAYQDRYLEDPEALKKIEHQIGRLADTHEKWGKKMPIFVAEAQGGIKEWFARYFLENAIKRFEHAMFEAVGKIQRELGQYRLPLPASRDLRELRKSLSARSRQLSGQPLTVFWADRRHSIDRLIEEILRVAMDP